jgi:plastocyanin
MTPVRLITLALAALCAFPAAAGAKERVLTLYSPAINTNPYVHDTHRIPLRANGKEAPARAGYVTGIKEQSLVDSKDPDAKPLPNAKFMIHHFVYLAPGRVEDSPNSCWSGGGFITGRGEEHPDGKAFDRYTTPEYRAKYGIANRMPNGDAPNWLLIAMVMNHVKRPKKVYVRTRVYYSEEERTPVYPTVVGDCARLGEGMAYDVPGGGAKGSNFKNTTTWTAPFDGRILLAASHQHGGAKYHTLRSETCGRRVYKAPTYYGPEDHIYNTIRPILHEPGPIANGTFRSGQGVPIREGEVFTRTGVHDNSNLHVASMAFWALFLVKDESVSEDCAPLPDDITDVARPPRFDRTPNHGLVVPQLSKPTGAARVFRGGPLTVGDEFFKPERIRAKAGQTVTWRFDGYQPHTVTVANGPRGFSSVYFGQTEGDYSFTPKVKGTYRMTCLVHPTTMGQDLIVE